MSVKQFAVCLLASVAATAAMAQSAPPVTLVVNDEVQMVQTPMQSGMAGISYAQSGGSTSSLKVYTQGFLFCTNIYPDTPPSIVQVGFTPAHEDQSFSPAHPWSFITTVDTQTVVYNGSSLTINRNANGVQATTLACNGTGAVGDVPSGITDGIFDNGLESQTETNFDHLVNWVPNGNFSWSAPDWTQVPADGCDTSTSARVVEDVACAAATGVRRAPASRYGSMWTATDGINFTYLFRIDGRVGAQIPNRPAVFQRPLIADGTNGGTVNYATVSLTDAYEGGDAGQVGLLGSTGQYCFLTSLPSVLDNHVCDGSSPSPLSGNLSVKITLGALPIGSGVTQSYYVAVTRPVVGGHPNLATPVVGASISIDPLIVAEGGDKFSGDDVVFGFMPTSSGFPWMTGQ